MATLDGLLKQTYRHFEVVVVPGPCTDDTLAVLARYPSLRIAPCAEARIGAARNIAINAAAGDVVAFVDDDGVPRAAWLEQLAAAYAEPQVAAAGGFTWDSNKDCIQWQLCTCTRTGQVEVNAAMPARTYQGSGSDPFHYLPGCNMSFRRSVLEAVGGFNDALSANYEDVDVSRRIIDAGYAMAVLPSAVVDHGSASNDTRDASQTVRDPTRLVQSFAVYICHNPPPGAGAAEVRSIIANHCQAVREYGRWQASTGQLAPSDLPKFEAGIDEGQRQGLRDGSLPRRTPLFSRANPAKFRLFLGGTGWR